MCVNFVCAAETDRRFGAPSQEKGRYPRGDGRRFGGEPDAIRGSLCRCGCTVRRLHVPRPSNQLADAEKKPPENESLQQELLLTCDRPHTTRQPARVAFSPVTRSQFGCPGRSGRRACSKGSGRPQVRPRTRRKPG